ncbi:LPS-assembly protein LptD [Methylopila henanensis]|uniref:LPS-assembly protein LptD n=1 Tax=Methylopila henanensis TaxID=873516 RepID=A0ABW4K3D1_9HYPH
MTLATRRAALHRARKARPVAVLTSRIAALALLGSASLLALGATASAQVANEFIPAPPKHQNAKSRGLPNALGGGAVVDGGSLQRRDPNARMLMEAKELVYDYNTEVVTAVGPVDIYYDGRALQAERVIYDQKKNRVRAAGNVKLTERDGNIVYADSLDLTDDFRDGFVDSLRVHTTDRTRFAAARGRREEGKLSVFDRGVYTACEPCRENPEKPPLWQIKAKRIIFREDEKMVYYEDATFELWGQPIAWLPFFSHPDPSVKRKSGFLAPSVGHASDLGYTLETPYFWAIAPNMDATLSPMFTSKQGVMMKGEFRHRLIDGAYSIRAAGIHQLDADEFNDKLDSSDPNSLTVGPGDKKNRWAFSTDGRFAINDKWTFGWDVSLYSDKWVRGDYSLWGSSRTAVSTLYLQGQGDRSWFDLRGYHFYGMTRYDRQDRLPNVAPVLDYNYVFEDPVQGGELAFNLNATSLYREESEYRRGRLGVGPRNDVAVIGAAGTYSRLSADAQWRRRFIDPIGQVWTPFAFVRGDLIYTNPDDDARLGPFLDNGQDALLRGMAGVGLEYRYPFVAQSSYGTHQIEPIAQILLRPNETNIGDLPNEDAQSLTFDDTTLFAWDKFSGYDRVEGGSRANVGLQYTLTMNSGAMFNVMFGQSYHLFGRNSFAKGGLDATRTGLDSGLETTRSDYVAGFTIVPTTNFALGTHFRFDEDSFAVRSAEIEGRATLDRFQANVAYGRYDRQAKLGYDDIREGVLAGARVFVTKDLYVGGGARYNFDRNEFDRTQVGFGVNNIQDCISLAFDYIREYDVDTSASRLDSIDHRFLLRVDLRTLGSVSASTSSSSDVFDSESSRANTLQ